MQASDGVLRFYEGNWMELQPASVSPVTPSKLVLAFHSKHWQGNTLVDLQTDLLNSASPLLDLPFLLIHSKQWSRFCGIRT
jgi:hypothetical protein